MDIMTHKLNKAKLNNHSLREMRSKTILCVCPHFTEERKGDNLLPG